MWELRRRLRPEGRGLLHDRRCASKPAAARWGAELSPDETPWEAGLGHAVKMDKAVAFVGREALRAQLAAGIRKRLVTCSRSTIAAVFRGAANPSCMDGRNVGELTSTGYSRRLGRAIAMGYARADLAC